VKPQEWKNDFQSDVNKHQIQEVPQRKDKCNQHNKQSDMNHKGTSTNKRGG
jgi:hypothetical protein